MNSSASFPANHGFLAGCAPAVAMDLTCSVDHPVAGNQVGYRVPGDGLAHSACAIGLVDVGRDILVANQHSRWDRQQRLPDFHLEVGAFEQ